MRQGKYMHMADRTDMGFMLTLLLSLGFGVLSLLSAFTLIEYIIDRRVSTPFYMDVCVPILMTLSLIIIMAVNVANGRMITKVSKSPKSLRAMYISFLFPVILLSFIFACFKDGFKTTLIFGFPFFLVGTIALPYSAYVLAKEAREMVRENTMILTCYNCNYNFQMNRLDLEGLCPVCGVQNRIVPPTSPPGNGIVSPKV